MRFIIAVLVTLIWSTTASSQVAVRPASDVTLSGQVISIGSGSGNEVFSRWAAAFMERHPGTTIDVTGSGSGSAFPALIEGRSDIAPMSRPMTDGMIDAFTKTKGYPPMVFDIGIGGVVVFVHPSNPLTGLTRSQLDGIYSYTYYLSPIAILSWGDAGLEGDWAGRPITLYGTRDDSGAFGLMRSEATTLSGRMKPTLVQLENADAVAAAVAADPNGIGFAPIGFQNDQVRLLAIGADDGTVYVGTRPATEEVGQPIEYRAPSIENLEAGTYPLTRSFRLYVDQNPSELMPDVLREFIDFIMSIEAQSMLSVSGYVPLPRHIATTQAGSLR